MKVELKAAPAAASPQANAPMNARARAVAKLNAAMEANAAPAPHHEQTNPVRDPNNISAEEMGAISHKTGEEPKKDEEEQKAEGQNTNGEGGEAAVEAQPPEATQETKKEDPLSSQYAILARKEKAFRETYRTKMAELKAKEAEIATREAATKGQPQFDANKYIPKDRLKADTLAVLAEEGVSYEELTNAILSQQQQDPMVKAAIQRLEAQVQEAKAMQERTAKAYEDQQTQNYQQALNQIRNEATNLVKTDPNFEMIQVTGSVGDVVDLIEKTFKQDGVLLSVEEAAQSIEEYLVEEAIKLTKAKKLQQKLAPPTKAASTTSQQAASQNKQQQQPMKTLTNAVGSSRQLTSKERAILAFKGELKSG